MSTAFFYLLVVVVVLAVVWLALRKKDNNEPTATPLKKEKYDNPINLHVTITHSKTTLDADAEEGNDVQLDKDAWEGDFYEAENPLDVKKSFDIVYTDGNGKTTERIVDVQKFDEQLHGGIVLGHCRMRKANRTFRFDRISKCIDIETGELITDIPSYLKSAYELSPEASRDNLIKEHYDVLRVLLYVGKADGQYRKAEKVVVRDACRKLANDERVTDEMVDDIISRIEAPGVHSFKLAVGRLAKSQGLRIDVLEVSKQIVDTQSNITANEQEALDYLTKRPVRHLEI